jgi:O-antigen/teichoic acid export membrane protein
MSSGAFLNVLISLGLYPIVTRLFAKEHFGGVGLFMAVVGVISLLGTSLYPSGLVIPKYRRDFYALVKLSLMLMTFTVVLTIGFIYFFTDTFVSIFKLSTIRSLLPLIPLGIFLSCIRDISTNWNIRNKDFKKNAFSNVVSSGGLKATNIGYAFIFGPSALGLILSTIISIILAIFTLGIVKMRTGIKVLSRISFKESIAVGKKYKKYPLNLLPGNLINRYTSDLPIYLLTAYFSPAITGAFVLANSLMNIPVNVIGTSISSVFLQRANELFLRDPKELSYFAGQTNRKLLLVGAPVFGILFGFGDLIFTIGFGSEWTLAGQFAIILSTYFIFKLVSSPIARVFRIVGKEQYSLYVSIVLAIVRSLGILLGVQSGDSIKAILYFTIANVFGYFITYILVFKACNLPIIKTLIESLLIITLCFSLFFMIRYCLGLYFNVFKLDFL